MAGDWIKMRGNLWDDPRITSICEATDSGEAAVIGGLYWLWATADQHSEDGIMLGLTTRSIDRKTGIQGLGEALIKCNWIADHPEGIRIIRFEEHNGESAKRRLVDAKRKANVRKDSDKAQTDNGQRAEDLRETSELEEEKELEKEKITSKPLKSKAEPRGTRLASDWIAPAEYIEFCKTARPDLDPHFMQDKFRDYWHPKAGKDGVKLDWLGTWRNFVRSERSQPQARGSPARESRHSGFEKLDYSEGIEDGRIT